MLNQFEKYGRNSAIAFSIVIMLFGLFFSRAFLSGSMMFFLAFTLVHPKIGSQLRTFINNRFLISITLLFMIPLISGLWSSNTKEWGEIIRIKLPLMFFPLAFAGDWQLKRKHWEYIAFIFLGLMAVAVGWSLWQYISDIEGFNEAYLRSKTIITPLQDDHVRFSWLCAFAVMLCVMMLDIQEKFKIGLYILAALFIIYLHILSARMGLFSLYIFMGLYAVWLLVKKRNTQLFIAILSGLLLLPLLSWFIFPTFRNRIQYFLYDLSLVKNEPFVTGSNDGARIQSLKAGWELVKENPLGVGAGDLKPEIFKWYELHVPAMGSGEKFLPCSEWLIYGGFAGWIGIILLTIIMAIPFFVKNISNRFFWIALHAMVAFSFAMDMTIEAQFGVFIYVFIVLWFWKWFQIKLPNEQ
jgi:O-antigen ligase